MIKFVQLLSSFLKTKGVLTALVGLTVVGGAAAASAASPGGHALLNTIAGTVSTISTQHTVQMTGTPAAKAKKTNNSQDSSMQGKGQATPSAAGAANCPGLPQAQQLAASFTLSVQDHSDDILAICALHQGTFKGTTTAGVSVSSNRVFGYGEIDQLLTVAQNLAKQQKTTLTSSTARSYLATVLQQCGTAPLGECLHASQAGAVPTSTPTDAGKGTPEPGNGKGANTQHPSSLPQPNATPQGRSTPTSGQ